VARLAGAREPDKFEREGAVFFEKLRLAYLTRAKENPARFCVINANQALDTVKNNINNILEEFVLNN
jgi:dTMP kinase